MGGLIPAGTGRMNGSPTSFGSTVWMGPRRGGAGTRERDRLAVGRTWTRRRWARPGDDHGRGDHHDTAARHFNGLPTNGMMPILTVTRVYGGAARERCARPPEPQETAVPGRRPPVGLRTGRMRYE